MIPVFTCTFTTHDLESVESFFGIGHVTAGVELSVLLLESIADESEINHPISTTVIIFLSVQTVIKRCFVLNNIMQPDKEFLISIQRSNNQNI